MNADKVLFDFSGAMPKDTNDLCSTCCQVVECQQVVTSTGAARS